MDGEKDELVECVYLILALMSWPSKKIDYDRILCTNDVQVGPVVWRFRKQTQPK